MDNYSMSKHSHSKDLRIDVISLFQSEFSIYFSMTGACISLFTNFKAEIILRLMS